MARKLTFTAVARAEGFANEFTAANEIGRIRMPYGEYEYGEAKCPDGRTRRVVQVWDRESAESVKSAMPPEGHPVYQGHPDVPDVAYKYPDKAAVGWITGIDAGDDAATLSVEWIANPGMGFKWFSPYWQGDADAPDGGGVARVHVSALTSVGLVNNPRIREFTLANEFRADNSATVRNPPDDKQRNGEMDIAKIASLLGLPVEGASEERIVEEIVNLQKAAVAAADDATAKVDAARAEAEAAKKAADDEKAKTAEAEGKFANERSAHIDLVLDNAVAGGNITVAGKAAWKARLEKDFEAGKTALFNEKAVKTAPAVTPEDAKRHNEGKTLVELANELMDGSNGRLSFHEAFLKAKKAHPEIA